MSSGTVCGQTPILDLAAGVREHLAAKGYKERDLIRLQKIWNHFARYADNCHFTIEIGAAFLRDAYGIEWAEFPPPKLFGRAKPYRGRIDTSSVF